MSDKTDEISQYPEGWRVLPIQLSIAISSTGGIIALGAGTPRNLIVTGQSLSEAFAGFVEFIENCADLGKPFVAFEGVNLR